MRFADQTRLYYINNEGMEQIDNKKSPIARGIFKR